MSAAAARRRKQLRAKKEAAAAAGDDSGDPVTARLHSLLSGPSATEESVAYEALQLAQSQVRRYVKVGKFDDASDLAYRTSLTLLTASKRASVASQLLAVLVDVLNETHAECDPRWVERFVELDSAYRASLDDSSTDVDPDERRRLMRLHLQFLRRALKWSTDLGTIRHGALGLHGLLGEQCWRVAADAPNPTVADGATTDEEAEEDDDDEAYDDDAETSVGLKTEAVTHLALAETPDRIAELLRTLPAPTAEELRVGHACPPAERDALLTRSILVFVAVENLRDATSLLKTYLDTIETRSAETLRTSYMDKTDGVAPSHVIFNSVLLRICEKSTKTGPLFSWILKSFAPELRTMHRPEMIKSYTTKIGRLYFDIQPPPNMMDMMENMMAMMGGGGAGGMGGMNPAMMQAMMQGGGGAM